MKTPERKIKKNIPFEALSGQLRQLADALDGRTGALPPEWADLPEPIAQLEVKGRAHGANWTLKVKIKAEPIPTLELLPTKHEEAAQATALPAGKIDLDYKQLKKDMKVAFKDIGASLAAQKRPAPEVMETFMGASEMMTRFKGAAYGEAYYPAFRKACEALRASYEASDKEALQAAYADLARLKKSCHQACK